MKILPVEASDQEILDAVREWVGLLAAERYTDACAFLYEDDESAPGWTPESMKMTIQNHGSLHPREKIFKVTSLEEAKNSQRGIAPCHDVMRFEDDELEGLVEPASSARYIIGIVRFDLPLNGSWSDLTALFDRVDTIVASGAAIRAAGR